MKYFKRCWVIGSDQLGLRQRRVQEPAQGYLSSQGMLNIEEALHHVLCTSGPKRCVRRTVRINCIMDSILCMYVCLYSTTKQSLIIGIHKCMAAGHIDLVRRLSKIIYLQISSNIRQSIKYILVTHK